MMRPRPSTAGLQTLDSDFSDIKRRPPAPLSLLRDATPPPPGNSADAAPRATAGHAGEKNVLTSLVP